MPILARIAQIIKRDPYMDQAMRDQKSADSPGCEEGYMQCRSQICDCMRSNVPTSRFVFSRAELLRNRGAYRRSRHEGK